MLSLALSAYEHKKKTRAANTCLDEQKDNVVIVPQKRRAFYGKKKTKTKKPIF